MSNTTLQYSPGQVVTIVKQILNSDGYRVNGYVANDGYVFEENLLEGCLADGYNVHGMTIDGYVIDCPDQHKQPHCPQQPSYPPTHFSRPPYPNQYDRSSHPNNFPRSIYSEQYILLINHKITNIIGIIKMVIQ